MVAFSPRLIPRLLLSFQFEVRACAAYTADEIGSKRRSGGDEAYQ
jgi:hypothetical protein